MRHPPSEFNESTLLSWNPRIPYSLLHKIELNAGMLRIAALCEDWTKQFAIRFQFDSEVLKEMMPNEQLGRCAMRPTFYSEMRILLLIPLCVTGTFSTTLLLEYILELTPLVEERSADCEQPLIILSVFLHPGFSDQARALPGKGISSINSVCNSGVFYFERVFPGRAPGILRYHIFTWPTLPRA
ncbi:LOW QUALITY PROTEIN: Hypothetical protein PHPALM_11392 [Phytophthora palmivora]|uniref:Uncharacterized protein n=1 Tax=Phytophthora palmivora TaxID=4796 RepID=A0A2P4Y2D9_9STRA|nr:LOW QUALITY PROTEIN: Hypothetical protein PHPALM_11392 [Phytophthora palmivora]